MSDPLAELGRVARAVGAPPLTPAALRRFKIYLDLLMVWNKAQRLTSLARPDQIIQGLFADSLLFFKVLPSVRPLRIVDIGAGAGIPGIPLGLADGGLAITLIEARRKRVSFLRAAVRELGLSDAITIIEGRAEAVRPEGARAAPPGFDVAVARAVMPIADLVPVCRSYVRAGGLVIASGPPSSRVAPDGGVGVEWRQVELAEFGVKRMFSIATVE